MAQGRSTEVVPGMAEAIERRRIELGLRPGEMARLAGLTAPGLEPVRKGYRRNYSDKVRFGVARALQWEPDAVERLLRGEEPRPMAGESPTEAAIYADPILSMSAKRSLVSIYRELLRASAS